jgi:hypothetical protein
MKHFIPSADEVWRLYNGRDPECVLFRQFCDEGHYGQNGPNGTRQGTYACTPSGRFLGSVNSNDPVRMEQMMREALRRWQAMDKKERLRSDDPKEQRARIDRAEMKYPEDGLVLRVHSRDLPREKKVPEEEWAEKAHNVDYAWFTRDEGLKFMPADLNGIAKKQKFTVPSEVLNRMVRLHIVDNVRGQTDVYSAEQLKACELTGVVKDIKKRGVTVEYEGKFELDAGTRAIKEGKLRGVVQFDLQKRDYVSFELVATGIRSGRTQYNFRERDEGPAPIGFVFVRVANSPSDRVAPAAFWEYRWR